MSSFSEGKRKKKENKNRKLISYLPSHTLTPRRRQRMCRVTPQLSRSGKIMGRVHLSSTWWQVSNKKQISGAWDAATQHTAWAISVLGAGNHQGTLNKHNSILLSSFKTQISGAEKRAGTKGIFLPAQLRKRNKRHKGWGRCYSNWDQANLKQLNFAFMSAQVTKGKRQ